MNILFRGTPYLWPVEGQISSFFGMRNGRPHQGIDIRAPKGKSIYAAKEGTVEFVGWKRGYGRTIIINHGQSKTLYAHLAAFKVRRKQIVDRGQRIGLVGNSGNSTGYHLHFEILKRANQ